LASLAGYRGIPEISTAEPAHTGNDWPMEPRLARVLVIEDEPAVRAILCRILKNAGHVVLEAESEWTALELTLSRMIDVVVMDVGLGSHDGIKTMVAIRRLQAEMPLIVASGNDRDEILGRMQVSGLRSRVWWLGKPFTAEKLLHVVEGALAG
jgi:DNA-binding response OmpR family regulator